MWGTCNPGFESPREKQLWHRVPVHAAALMTRPIIREVGAMIQEVEVEPVRRRESENAQ